MCLIATEGGDVAPHFYAEYEGDAHHWKMYKSQGIYHSEHAVAYCNDLNYPHVN